MKSAGFTPDDLSSMAGSPAELPLRWGEVRRRKKTLPSCGFWDESEHSLRGATQIQGRAPASFGLLMVRGGCRGRFRPRSAAVLRPMAPGPFQRWDPLCEKSMGVLLRHLRGRCVNLRTDCMHFSGKSQAMGRLEGLTMQRQSRSPRARPSTSISAVAMLLAKGMLFWSHRREI